MRNLIKMRSAFDGWRLGAICIAMPVALPVVFIFSSFLHPEKEIWQHLVDTILAELMLNTGILATGVLTGTFLIGVSLAWLTGVCEFPGRKLLSWALLLPLAIPTYVLAFVFLGIFDFSGPVQTFLRSFNPAQKIWFPNARSSLGVVSVMSLALYPYVYLLARNAFRTQGRKALEAAQSLGYSRWKAFYKVSLPMAHPWIAGGLLLVLMEALADFGAVSIFNFDTFTTAIYKAWYGFFSLAAAAQLSSVLILIIFAVKMFEQKIRSRMRFTEVGKPLQGSSKFVLLVGWRRWAASIYGFSVLLVAFAIPFIQLLVWSVKTYSEEIHTGYFGFLWRSLFFALFASLVITSCALFLVYTQRRNKDKATQMMVEISTLGYALPGTVLAVGLVFTMSYTDRLLAELVNQFGRTIPGNFVSGTFFTVIIAYMVRFMAVGFNPIASAMHRITPNLDEASISLGVSGMSLLKRVHVPMLRNGIFTAAMLAFVDVIKEMPITLMTRPFGWDTLAVKVFELTSEGEWQRAALPATVIVIAGLLPVILLTSQTERDMNSRAHAGYRR